MTDPIVRYHLHEMPDGTPYLTGDMSATPRWEGPGCPPECRLPRPPTADAKPKPPKPKP